MNFLVVIRSSLLAILTCTLFCCKQDDSISNNLVFLSEDGNEIEVLWIQSLDEDQNGGNVASFLLPSVVDGIVTSPSSRNDQKDWSMMGLDSVSGEVRWIWNDFLGEEISWDSDIGQRQSKSILIEFENDGGDSQSFYAINLITGGTLWKEERSGRSFSVEPYVINDSYYFSYYPTHKLLRPVFYKGSIYSNSYEEIFTLPLDSLRENSGGHLGRITDFNYFVGREGHEFLIIPYTEYQVENTPYPSKGHFFMGLYDLTKDDWVYPKAKLREYAIGFNSSRPVIYQDRIAVVNFNYEIIAIDLYTGEELWSKGPYEQGSFEYTLVDDVVVIAPYIGANPIARGLNVETGNQLWQLPSGGGASHLSELNGVVYWKDRGDGDLYAVDAKTGEKYWQLDDPDPESDSWWKSDGVAVIEGKNGEPGRIFASSHKRMYCLEAVR